ncbi:hypothetical protein J4G43_048090 [Bradyrhizobium barranii subsp. barranii]|uniref:DUF4375 domain-containing protein n=1 Tax=Bradyrhizobium barranii subsp. barranii TaxID=2823807 RepID=A0A939MMA2_9BRAD|nr:hypothetical protein [Bradyrhizobium barranii]UEM12114.1 hypothetical protein J4G43_048090 [Bradyrhizobium barranii subsp. barranii]
MTRRSILLLLVVALLAGNLAYASLSGPSAFARDFDQNIARYPLAASIAHSDPSLRQIFLRETEAAFNEGGWPAASGVLNLILATEMEAYADDEHINAVDRAKLAALLKLASDPLACKSYLLAGSQPGEFADAAQEFADLGSAHRAAIENGFERKMKGVARAEPSDAELAAIETQLRLGPFAELTRQELGAQSRYLGGNAALMCSAATKKQLNLLSMDSADSASASRMRRARNYNIDVAEVRAKLCREPGNGLSCS